MKDEADFYFKLAQKPVLKLKRKYILCTLHGAEKTDNKNKLLSIFKALDQINDDIQIILPIHPRTLKNARNTILIYQN